MLFWEFSGSKEAGKIQKHFSADRRQGADGGAAMNKITLSFDDGEHYDKRAAELLRKYRLAATFYLCSEHIGAEGICASGRHYKKPSRAELAEIYSGFEIGSHGSSHESFTSLGREELFRSIKKDIDTFSKYSDRPVICCAYPGGDVDERVISDLNALNVISFARAVPDGKKSFAVPENRYCCIPTGHIFDEDIYDTLEAFRSSDRTVPRLLHLYGHSYEIENTAGGWQRFEKLLKYLSEITDAAFMTNGEAYTKCFEG